jgi:putative transposase
MHLIYEKKHRLDNVCYTGNLAISFTACVKDKKELFVSDNVFYVFEKSLIEELNRYGCDAFVYVFMPDHLHLIVKGREENSNLKKGMDSFKQKTGFWLAGNMTEYRWQKDYYDHIIRDDENLETAARYVLLNPVRKSMVDGWHKYKYKGSTIFNLDEWE